MEKKKNIYESQRKAAAKWDKKNSRSITLKCYYKTDMDILNKLQSVDNRQSYIKELIRADIAERVLPADD